MLIAARPKILAFLSLLIVSIGAPSINAMDTVNYLNPTAIKYALKTYPMTSKVADSTIEAYLKNNKHPLLENCYPIAKNLLFYTYLSSKHQNLISLDVVMPSIKLLLMAIDNNTIKSMIIYGMPYLPLILSSNLTTLWLNIPFEILYGGSNTNSTGYRTLINLCAYVTNAYIHHAIQARDNTTWKAYGINIALAYVAHEIIINISKKLQDIALPQSQKNAQRAVVYIVNTIKKPGYFNSSKIPDYLKEFAQNKEIGLTREEKNAILNIMPAPFSERSVATGVTAMLGYFNFVNMDIIKNYLTYLKKQD